MTLHPVDVSQIDPVDVTVTGAPEIDFIKISNLVIDDSSIGSDVRYYNSFGLGALVPSVVSAGVTRPEVLTAFLDDHNLDTVARRVERIRDLPEHRGKSFQSLFADSVTVMLKAHAAQNLAG